MRFLIDSGNITDIKKYASEFPLWGMTTNPDIIAREKTHPLDLYRRIHAEVPQLEAFHIQVVSKSTDGMVEEALHIRKVLTSGTNALQKDSLYIKVPVNHEGVAAMMRLRQLGIQFTATGIFTSVQILIAGKVGASFAAPYITPIFAHGGDGIQVIKEGKALYDQYGFSTEILGAGFSNESQVSQAGLAGAKAVTLPAVMFDKILNVPQTEVYTNRFNALFQDYAGQGNTLLHFDYTE